jgi:hypothetical protein
MQMIPYLELPIMVAITQTETIESVGYIYPANVVAYLRVNDSQTMVYLQNGTAFLVNLSTTAYIKKVQTYFNEISKQSSLVRPNGMKIKN